MEYYYFTDGITICGVCGNIRHNKQWSKDRLGFWAMTTNKMYMIHIDRQATNIKMVKRQDKYIATN